MYAKPVAVVADAVAASAFCFAVTAASVAATAFVAAVFAAAVASFAFVVAVLQASAAASAFVAASVAGAINAETCSGVKSSYLNASPFSPLRLASHSVSLPTKPFALATS